MIKYGVCAAAVSGSLLAMKLISSSYSGKSGKFSFYFNLAIKK